MCTAGCLPDTLCNFAKFLRNLIFIKKKMGINQIQTFSIVFTYPHIKESVERRHRPDVMSLEEVGCLDRAFRSTPEMKNDWNLVYPPQTNYPSVTLLYTLLGHTQATSTGKFARLKKQWFTLTLPIGNKVKQNVFMEFKFCKF